MADDLQNQQPSIDPAELDTLVGAFRFIWQKNLQNTNDMLPAKIITYDRLKNLATVQPMIKAVTTGGELLDLASVAAIPVLGLGGGGFGISFPLVNGSTGWIKANDRDISLYLQSGYQPSPPNTYRLHTFSDAMFIPDWMSQYTLNSDAGGNFTIQNTGGTSYFVLTDTGQIFDGSGIFEVKNAGGAKIDGGFGCNGAIPQGKVTLPTLGGGGGVAELWAWCRAADTLLKANGQAI